jgi:hypothetical protein
VDGTAQRHLNFQLLDRHQSSSNMSIAPTETYAHPFDVASDARIRIEEL